MANIKAAAIITAGGEGKRFGTGGEDKLPKQFIPLSGKPIIVYSLESFESSELVSEIVVVVPEGWVEYTHNEIVNKYNISKVTKVIFGGNERQKSVEKGFKSITSNAEIVVVHDGVRPFATVDLIEEVIAAAQESGGAIAACPSVDTVKKSDSDDHNEDTLARETIWLAQTPQAFKYDIINRAYEKASDDDYLATDEAALVERVGDKVRLVKSSKYNIKITNPEDIEAGEFILNSQIYKKI